MYVCVHINGQLNGKIIWWIFMAMFDCQRVH
jgi:hypothetical protein